MTPFERATLESIVQANGLMPVLELRKDVLRRMGLDGSRTKGFNRSLAQALQSLSQAGLIEASTGARPAPRNRHASVVGRDVKHHKTACCSVTDKERDSMKHVKAYNCVYFAATETGRNTLHV